MTLEVVIRILCSAHSCHKIFAADVLNSDVIELIGINVIEVVGVFHAVIIIVAPAEHSEMSYYLIVGNIAAYVPCFRNAEPASARTFESVQLSVCFTILLIHQKICIFIIDCFVQAALYVSNRLYFIRSCFLCGKMCRETLYPLPIPELERVAAAKPQEIIEQLLYIVRFFEQYLLAVERLVYRVTVKSVRVIFCPICVDQQFNTTSVLVNLAA